MPIDNVPIVVITRRRGKAIWLACPHCGERHMHGAGTKPPGAVYLGHRLSHCSDYGLRRARRLRNNTLFAEPPSRDGLGYFLVDLSATEMMDEGFMRALFDRMDARADELGWQPSSARSELAVEFRMLQTRHEPALTDEQFKDLFALWCDYYDGRQRVCEAERRDRLAALWKERADLLDVRRIGGAAAAAVHERLLAIGAEMAKLAMPPQYNGPLGEWPGAA